MLRTEGLQLRAGQFRVEDVSLTVREGEYFVLMGATGSGKSLLLKSICGLLRPAGGRIFLAEREAPDLEPARRGVGYVPQDCGLFPHMTVAENITYSLWARGLWPVARRMALGLVRLLPLARRWMRPSGLPGAGGRLAYLARLVDKLGIDYLLNRSPGALSGGERQKVAVARALAGRPGLLLLDEPVSSLDEPTRRETCQELRQTQQDLGITTVHVCHNLEEARSVSDRVGVMSEGRLVQVGPLDDLLSAPATPAVARLLHVPWQGQAHVPAPRRTV